MVSLQILEPPLDLKRLNRKSDSLFPYGQNISCCIEKGADHVLIRAVRESPTHLGAGLIEMVAVPSPPVQLPIEIV